MKNRFGQGNLPVHLDGNTIANTKSFMTTAETQG